MRFRDYCKYKLVANDIDPKKFITEYTNKYQICIKQVVYGGNDVTNITILRDGTIVQNFSAKFWSKHLPLSDLSLEECGVSGGSFHSEYLNKINISIGLNNYGRLLNIDGDYVAFPNDYGRGNKRNKDGSILRVIVNDKNVGRVIMNDGEEIFFEKLPFEQIDSLREMILWYSKRYNISLKQKYPTQFNYSLNRRALSGKDGVFFSQNYIRTNRPVYLQEELINMLKSIR
jgi:hypothetical protein